MSGTGQTPERYYTESIPEQWNRSLREQERLVEATQRTLDGMRGVTTTIRIIVRGGEEEVFYLNIENGVMSPGGSAANPPFLTVIQDRQTFEQFEREAGDSALGMLGGLSGFAGNMKLTSDRLKNLENLSGTLHFEIRGDDGFALLTHFGADPIPEEPTTSILVDREAYQELRDGRLDPQNAFMSGRIAVEGDMQLAMQLALAALTPD